MVKVTDLAFGRLSAPDLDLMEEFLTDFGMVRADRTKTALFMRGTDSDHHIHVTELGKPSFIGLAFYAASEEDLHIAAKADGASAVHDIDEPGGGKRVRLTDPNGFKVDIVHGIQPLKELDARKVIYNDGFARYNRVGDLQRLPKQPSHIKRSAHAVIITPDAKGSNAWYQKNLGLMTTDMIYLDDDKNNVLAIFNHVDQGEAFVDHHVFLCVQGEKPGINHLSFEVYDFDDVQIGHEYLKNRNKWKHAWGIGRHMLGSQIFDYWRDPWGRIHEHWTDSDMVNSKHPPGIHSAEVGLSNQWGPEFPESFLDEPEVHAIAAAK